MSALAALTEVAATLGAAVAVGAIVGVAMGALRTGGAAATAPLLIYAWESFDYAGASLSQTAAGTGAAAIALLAALALWAEPTRGALDRRAVTRLAPPAALGGAVGGAALALAPPATATAALGLAAVLAALVVVFVPPRGPAPPLEGWRGAAVALGLGAVAGGGAQGAGALGGPWMARAGASGARADALLAALGLAAAAPAALALMALGPPAATSFALGSVDLLAAAALAATASVLAPAGARAAADLPRPVLRLVHAALVIGLGLGLVRAATVGG